MLEKVRAAYTNYRSLSRAACVGLIICAALLYWLPGGFPPWAWRFLFQILPMLPHLWQVQGFAILLPLVGLICLSVMLLLLWGMLVVAFIKMAQYWWYALRERQRFLLELQEAELLAEQMAANEMQQVAAVASSQVESISATPAPLDCVSSGVAEMKGSQGYSVSHTAREGRAYTNGTSPLPGAFHSVEARTWPGPATSPEAPAIQHIQRSPQPVAAVSPYSSPALARGGLRLVPRPDEEGELDNDALDEFPEIEATPEG